MIVGVGDPEGIAVDGETSRLVEEWVCTVSPSVFGPVQRPCLSSRRVDRLDLRVVGVRDDEEAIVLVNAERVLEAGIGADAVDVPELEEVLPTSRDQMPSAPLDRARQRS